MAYLGNAPARSFISFERQVFTIVNSQTAYTLDHSVNNENDIRLVINNIVQEPGSGKAYTASGTTLTLSAALVNGTDEMYCVFLGRAVATNKPGAGSVGTTELAADAVTEAKIADDAVESEHLNDNVISGQTELAAEPADTDEFLISDAGTLKRIDYSHIKASGGTTFLYATSASSASSISVSSTYITTTHDLYLIFLSGKMGTDNANIKGQFLDSGGSAVASNYKINASRIGDSYDYSGVTTYFDLNNANGIGNDANEGFNVVGWLQNPTSNTITTSFDGFINYSNTGDSSRAEQFSCKRADGTEQHYGITFYPNSGTFAEIKISVLGYNKT